MKRWINNLILCAVLIAALAALEGCSHRPSPAKTGDGAVLFRLGFSGTPDSLNPYAAGNEEARAVMSLLYDTLFTADPVTGELQAGLCSEYTVSDSAAGARLWRITLRDDVYWHDGVRLTASDVEFSLQSEKELSVSFSYPACELLDVTGIAVEDDTHLAMVVWGEEEYIRSCLARIPILPRHIWNELSYMRYDSSGVAADPARARQEIYALDPGADMMVGSGLYRWGGYDNGVCTLALNDHYWNGTSMAEVLQLRFGLVDPTAELEAGRLDACWETSLSAFQRLSQSDSNRVTAGTAGEMYYLGFNFADTGSPVADARVRQALEYCTSRDAMLLYAFGGGFSERGLLSPYSPYYYMDEIVFDRPYSIETAQTLLENAGYSDTNGDAVRESRDGRQLRLKLLCSAGVPAWSQAAEILKAGCTAAGIGLDIALLPPEEYAAALLSGDYDMVLTSAATEPEPWFSLGAFYWDDGDNAYARSDAVSRGWNVCGYNSGAYDAIYEQLLSAAVSEETARLAAQAGEFLYNDSAAIVIGFSVQYQACTRVWSGICPCTADGLYFSPLTLPGQMKNLRAG